MVCFFLTVVDRNDDCTLCELPTVKDLVVSESPSMLQTNLFADLMVIWYDIHDKRTEISAQVAPHWPFLC
jgi:hypothetical protein